ncbi:MAG: DUF4160 domain-containing protein [Candidatus Omnitrophica bacterium]|nr:DUF4160 domain-containing protein [Candidatus Omnitrophota bacterium]
MPEICRFYGIVIKMFFEDHIPAHFHVEYGSFEALIGIDTLAVIAGKLPPRALGLVMEWAALHQKELLLSWQNAKNQTSPGKIEPLK